MTDDTQGGTQQGRPASQPASQPEDDYTYRMSEGAVLRGDSEHGIGLQVYHPGRGWVWYDRASDWWSARAITPEDARREIEREEAMRRQ